MAPEQDWKPESRWAWWRMLLRGPRAWPRSMLTDIARIVMVVCAAAMANALTPLIARQPDSQAPSIVFAFLAALPILSMLVWREVDDEDEVVDRYDLAMAAAAMVCEALFAFAALAALVASIGAPGLHIVGIVVGMLTAGWQLRESAAELRAMR